MRKQILATLILLSSLGLSAQYNINELGKKDIYFGIAIGGNVADYTITHARLDPANDSIRYFRPGIGPGFNLGIIGNYQFHKNFDLRFIPTLSFSDKAIIYEDLNSNKIKKTISSIYLDFPLLLRFKSKPIKDFRIYAIAGVRYDFDLASNVKARKADDIIKVNRHDAGAELGIGMMIYFPYFILSPEFKVSHGFVNILSQTPGLIYSRTIQRMYSRTFTITLNLEG
ncbi:MAG: PorT family protein [Bacteroidetes bacterium]|nr:PorT family protein [Bacteroidota bacterium]